jgi:hypothetical protein
MATLPEFEEGEAPERLPVSLWFYVRLLAFGALLILIVVQIDAPAGAITAAAIAAVALLFYPRGLVLDEEGFRVLSLVPRKKVLWNAVDSFSTGWVPRGGAIFQYTKAGRKPRWCIRRRVGRRRAVFLLRLPPSAEAEPCVQAHCAT